MALTGFGPISLTPGGTSGKQFTLGPKLETYLGEVKKQQEGVAAKGGDILTQLLAGASPAEQKLVQQIGQGLFEQGATQFQEQARRLMAGISSSAASRGLGASSIGLGGLTAVGNRTQQLMAQLRNAINTQSAEQLLGLPFQRADLATRLLGLEAGLGGQGISGLANILLPNKGGGGNAGAAALGSIISMAANL